MNRVIPFILLAAIVILFNSCSSSQHSQSGVVKRKDSKLLAWLLNGQPDYFDSIVAKKNELNVQIIYTQIDRTNGKPVFTDHYFNVNPDHYFYPASTVKLPVALLALQRLHELNIKGLDKNTTMITGTDGDEQTGVNADSSAANGKPGIAQYIRKIFLVSDNDAFNRLYEFLGQEYINNELHKKGYIDAQIITRLTVALTEEQNRHTNPVHFEDAAGHVIYNQPAMKSNWVYNRDEIKQGIGYMKDTQLVQQPFDFTLKNRLTLQDLHSMMRSVIVPESVPVKSRFGLTEDDYRFLHTYMPMYPRESDFPHYDKKEYPDTYAKHFLFFDDSTGSSIRVFDKSGTAYGYLTDVAYISDTANKIEFFLSATIYCNSDGIFNDDHYDYETVGYPFLKHLAKTIYEYELKRK